MFFRICVEILGKIKNALKPFIYKALRHFFIFLCLSCYMVYFNANVIIETILYSSNYIELSYKGNLTYNCFPKS